MASCLNSSSASALRPAFMSCNAWSYCCAARAGTGMGSAAGALIGAPGAAAVALPVPLPAALGVPAVLPLLATLPALAACPAPLAGWLADGAGAGARAGNTCAWWHAASIASAARLANRFDQLFTDFHLAVAAWVELRERSKALLHPFIVGAVLGSRG